MVYRELEKLWEQEQKLKKDIIRQKYILHRMREEGAVSDVVTGTRKDGTIGRIRISGIRTESMLKQEQKLKEKKDELKALQSAITDKTYEVEWEIFNCPDSETRLLLRWHYLDRRSWRDIAMRHDKAVSRCHRLVKEYIDSLSDNMPKNQKQK